MSESDPDFGTSVDAHEQERAAINVAAVKVASRVVTMLCGEMISASVKSIANNLEQDQAVFQDYEAKGFPAESEHKVSVYPNSVEAPFKDDKPIRTLAALLVRQQFEEDPEMITNTNDRFLIMVPTPEGYVYPELLDPEYRPAEMYVKYIPDPRRHEPGVRYIIGIAEDQTGYIRRYESEDDGVEQQVFDEMSSEVLWDQFTNRIPDDFDSITGAYRRFVNFDVVPSKAINIKTSEEE